MQKLIFWDSGLVPFFCWLKPGGSIRKNGKLTEHVSFVYRALFILTESVKNHVLNIFNWTVFWISIYIYITWTCQSFSEVVIISHLITKCKIWSWCQMCKFFCSNIWLQHNRAGKKTSIYIEETWTSSLMGNDRSPVTQSASNQEQVTPK